MANKKHWSELSSPGNPFHERVRIFRPFDGDVFVYLFDRYKDKNLVSRRFFADNEGFMTKTQFDRAYEFALGLSQACHELENERVADLSGR